MVFLVKMRRHTVYKALSLLLPFQILFIYFALRHFSLSQNSFYNNFYNLLVGFIRKLTGFIPISVGDVFYTVLFFVSLNYLRLFFKKKSKYYILKLTSLVSVLYFCFYLFWGLNYAKVPLYKSLNLNLANTNTQSLNHLTTQLINKVNTLQIKLAKNDTLKVVSPDSKKEILLKSTFGYSKLATNYPFFTYNNPSIKFSLYSTPLSYMGYAGYYNPFTAEAQVNSNIVKSYIPFTASHEVAHQLGFAPEQEANFVGYLACINSDDAFVQFSGYLVALSYTLSDLRHNDAGLYKKQMARINKGILKNYAENYRFWKAHRNPTTPLFESFYDSFLKVNKQTDGIKSYSGIVKLLIAYHKRQPLNKS